MLTLIQDLGTRSVNRVAFPPGATRGAAANIAIIDRQSKVQYDEMPVQCDVIAEGGAHALKLVAGGTPGFVMANGLLLGFEVDWSTVADITRVRRYVVGRGYAGCLYTVLDTGNGQYKCVHTSREGGAQKNPEATVELLQAYVMRNRYRVVHQVPTAGLIGNPAGCTQVYIVTKVDYTINPRPTVQTARLQIGAAGLVVAADTYSSN